MPSKYYKGYRIGSIEKEILKTFLGVSSIKFTNKKLYDETWSEIFETARQKSEMPVVFNRLQEKGFIKLVYKNDELLAILTKKGRQYLRENILIFSQKNNLNKVWDGKWHIVIFDIPESRRKTRNMLRFHIKKIGFIQVQGSVWIYPYTCSELVALVKTNFKLNNEVAYIVADSIEGEDKFMKFFKISRK